MEIEQMKFKEKKYWFKKSVALYLVIIVFIIALAGGFLYGKSLSKTVVITEAGQIVVDKSNEELDTNQDGVVDEQEFQNVSQSEVKYGQVLDKIQIPDYLQKDVNFYLFWDLWSKIQNNYIDRPVGETKLFYGAMAGLVRALDDPYSVFLEPEPAEEFKNDLSGKFEGIGAEIGMRDNLITVISPLPDSPAQKSGLMPKDKIIEIDGYSAEDLSLNEAVLRIRGPKGTPVVLKIYRPNENVFHEITIVRDTIKLVSVVWEMKENNLAYIKITNFNSDTDSRLQQTINEILLTNPKGVVLDLRNNPGGYLDQAVSIASHWITGGNVVVQEEFAQDEKTKKYLAGGSAELRDFPAVVLVNGGSASASEIVAGALRDYGIAELVGTQTFGKGSVQSLETLADGSAVKLTVARWLTPEGNQIDVVGLAPDVEVDLTQEDFDNDRDPQLDKAIELLKW